MTDPTQDPDLVARYFEEYVRKGFRRIFEEQRKIASSKIYSKKAFRTDGTERSRSGALMWALRNPELRLEGSGSSLEAAVDYPTYLRFLDMKRLGNYRIYNRPIWGILYSETIRDIRYEFREWCEKLVRNAITDSYKQ